MMKRFYCTLISIIVLFLFVSFVSGSAFAGVNLKNGNFYISYTDVVVPGGQKLEVSRTYNSKASKIGWFGYGWGSDYETYLVVSPDGSVVIHENGSGAETRFVPGDVNAEAAAEKIVKVMREKANLQEKAARDLTNKLKNDAELRLMYAEKFEIKSDLAAGTVLHATDRGLQELKRTKEGFERTYNDGKTEIFNPAGKLVKVTDKTGYAVNLTYDSNNNNVLRSVKDSQAKQLFFEWHPDGKIKSAWNTEEKKASYKFDDKNNLEESTDVAGNIYKYKYDNNHNLTQIAYQDKSSMDIKYDPKNQMVLSIKDKSGIETGYKYGSNNVNPDLHYWTMVTKPGADSKLVTNRYEYELKKKKDGSTFTYRIYTEVNGLKTETIYDEISQLPAQITRGKHVTNFKYNNKGLLTEKNSTTGENIKLEYDDKINKIKKVVNNDGWTKFEYDKKGNLYKAENSTGKAVLLIYDRNGLITKMVDDEKSPNKDPGNKKEKRILSFKYNAIGKPVEIVMENVGKINVAYDNDGEIKKVESKEGHKMALEVTQAFQNLLSIVKPAGVNLNL
ncbi:MAG: RHS repeat protein [Oligoflexia bacterium]|nr:RHS repeat protein [Oligoflexia bacterium]